VPQDLIDFQDVLNLIAELRKSGTRCDTGAEIKKLREKATAAK
jgi:hypothetical protein